MVSLRYLGTLHIHESFKVRLFFVGCSPLRVGDRPYHKPPLEYDPNNTRNSPSHSAYFKTKESTSAVILYIHIYIYIYIIFNISFKVMDASGGVTAAI